MRKRPLISVLVLAYNHEAFAETAIKSILGQVGEFDLELVYCDDASTDRTRDIVGKIAEADGRIKLVLRTKNVGIVPNFLDGLRKCSGDYIAYCDGDDFWNDENKLSVQLEFLNRHKACSFSFHDMMIVDENGRHCRLWSRGRQSERWESGVKQVTDFLGASLIVFHASSVLFRRQAIDKEFLNKIDRSWTGLDYALALMLGNSGDGYYLLDAMAAYRRQPRSVSASQRTPSGYLKVLQQVRSLESLANEHFDGRFAVVCRRNRRGHVIQALQAFAEMWNKDHSIKALAAFVVVSLASGLTGLLSSGDIFYLVKARLLRKLDQV